MTDTWVRSPQRTVVDLLAARVADDPDSLVLDVCGVTYTARELDAASNRVANGLASIGVGHGDRVATLLENSPAAVLAFYGAVKLGAIYVPVNTNHKGVFLEHQLMDADAKVLVVQGDLADRITKKVFDVEALEHIVCVGDPIGLTDEISSLPWDDLAESSDMPPAVTVSPADVASLIYTGGTTGPSKGCALSHNYMVHMTAGNAVSWGRTAHDVVWTPLPLYHFNALGVCLLGTLSIGGSAVITRKFSVSNFWRDVSEAGATIASLLGSPAVMIARAGDNPYQPRSGAPEANTTLRMVTGAPMPVEIDTIYRERFGITTWSYAYGTTEASLLSHLPPGVPPREGSAGIANIDDFDVRIFDDDDNELPTGTDGEIVCRPKKPNVMFSGYWRRPEATVDCGGNWWFHTGDVGRIDEDGYLFFVDRKADYLRRRGENISSWELEQTFHQHDLVADCAVCGVPSDVGEDEVKLTVVLQPGARLTEEQLCRWSFTRVPHFAVPRYIEFRPDLPRNQTGRIIKAALRADGITPTTWDREATGVEVPR